MLKVLARHGVRALPALARDHSGQWPDEEGFAVLDQTHEFAAALAHAFEQFAFYDVSEHAVLVCASSDGEVLV
jgi:hypothetical protein